jgi:hypothetical protein
VSNQDAGSFESFGAPAGWAPEGNIMDIFAGASVPATQETFDAWMINTMLRDFLPGWTINPQGKIQGPINPSTGRAPTLGWASPQAVQGAIGPMTFDPITGYVYAPGVPGIGGKLNNLGLSHADRAGLALFAMTTTIEHVTVIVDGQPVETVVMTPDALLAHGWSFSPEPSNDPFTDQLGPDRGGQGGEGGGAGG